MQSTEKPATIIIPTLNRDTLLLETLPMILMQDYSDFHIIVIDQSDSPLPALVAYCKNDSRITFMQSTIKSSSYARNAGLNAAKGQYIVFLDDDIVISEKTFLTKLLQPFQNTNVGAIQGRFFEKNDVPGNEIKEVGTFDIMHARMTANFNYNEETAVHHLQSVNCACRKDLIDRIGSFNALFKFTHYFEDAEIGIRIEKLGYALVFNPHATLTHLQESRGGNRELDVYKAHYSYCYNFTVLILCNYSLLPLLIHIFRQILRRTAGYILKRFRKEKYLYLKASVGGTCYAIYICFRELKYVIQRRKLR